MRNILNFFTMAFIVIASLWQIGCDKNLTEGQDGLKTMTSTEYIDGNLAKEIVSKLLDNNKKVVAKFNALSKNASVDGFASVAVEDLGIAEAKFRLKEDGIDEIRNFTLVSNLSNKTKVDAENTFIVLSPDEFLVEDGADGEEVWPVKAEAYSFAESSNKRDALPIEVEEDGQVTGLPTNSTIVFLSTVADPSTDEPEVNYNATSLTEDYLALKSVYLGESKDSDGAEVYMHLQHDDDYTNTFSRRPAYDFNRTGKELKAADGYYYDTSNNGGSSVHKFNLNYAGILYSFDQIKRVTGKKIKGETCITVGGEAVALSDGSVGQMPIGRIARCLGTPDSYEPGQSISPVVLCTYSGTVIRGTVVLTYTGTGSCLYSAEERIQTGATFDYFPLVRLNDSVVSRLVITEDDLYESYHAVNSLTNSNSYQEKPIQTFDFSTGQFASVNTRINGWHNWRRSDEMLQATGMRRINKPNVIQRQRNSDDIPVRYTGLFGGQTRTQDIRVVRVQR